jgi:hypothetical protein
MLIKDTKATFSELPDYPAAIGSTIRFSGDDAGADKFFHVKGIVKADGLANERPRAPTAVVAAVIPGAANSQFFAADAGDYSYTVHQINRAGISEGITIAAPVTVGAGVGVRLTITPDTAITPTGFVICRTAKDGDVTMEMVQIPANMGGGTTVFTDLNKDLPGTASMLFLTETRITPVYTFSQLLPLSTFPLYPTAKAETPFLILLFASLEVRAPEFCGLVKNLHYQGGLIHG